MSNLREGFTHIGVGDRLREPMFALDDDSIAHDAAERVVPNSPHGQIARAIWRVCSHEPIGVFVTVGRRNDREEKTFKRFCVEHRPIKGRGNTAARS
jgi:hypothetical protein